MAGYGLGYQNVLVHAVGWAPTVRQDGETWLTTWTVRLREPLGAGTAALDETATDVSRAEPYFRVDLSTRGGSEGGGGDGGGGGREIFADVVTREQGQDAAYWDPTYALLTALDARIGRIWTVNGSPRQWYPPFQAAQQRLLDKLDDPARRVFLANCIARVTPFFEATVLKETEHAALFRQAEKLVAGSGADRSGPSGQHPDYSEHLSRPSRPSHPDHAEYSDVGLPQVFEALSALPEWTYPEGRHALGEVRREAVTAVLAALHAVLSRSVQSAALCARKSFDAAYLFDQFAEGPQPEGLGFVEDELWCRDVHDLLAANGADDFARVRERSAQAAAKTSARLVIALGDAGG
jgi:hypothetical protein